MVSSANGQPVFEGNEHEPRRRLDFVDIRLRPPLTACGFFVKKRPLEGARRIKLPVFTKTGLAGDRFVFGAGGVAVVFR